MKKEKYKRMICHIQYIITCDMYTLEKKISENVYSFVRWMFKTVNGVISFNLDPSKLKIPQ